MAKQVYIIHGWGGSPTSEPWFEWLREVGMQKGWEVVIPKMPDTDHPTIEGWVTKLKEIVKPGEETYLIGHSIGAQAIMRFLDTHDVSVKGFISVAGWFNLLETGYEDPVEEKKIAKPWFDEPIQFENVKNNAGMIVAIFSDDDECVPVSDAKLFEERLDAKTIIKEKEGHFNETKEINEIVEYIEQ